MTAFWVAVVVGAVISVAYVALAIQAFLRVRRDVLALAASGDTAELDVTALDDEDAGTFTWKALGAVVASTVVIILLGLDSLFWYVPPMLAIGTAIAVVAAFFIDRRSAS